VKISREKEKNDIIAAHSLRQLMAEENGVGMQQIMVRKMGQECSKYGKKKWGKNAAFAAVVGNISTERVCPLE
jgi:hypothetical protein